MFFVLLSIFLLCSNNAFSYDLKDYSYLSPSSKTSSISKDGYWWDKANELSIALHGFNLNYKETISSVNLENAESGLMVGATVAYNSKRIKSFFQKAFVQFCKMDEDFESSSSTTGKVTGKTNSSFFRVDFTLHYSIDLGSYDLYLIPYLGGSFRLWNREMKLTDSDNPKEITGLLSFPLGCELRTINEYYAAGISAGLNLMVKGFTETKSAYYDGFSNEKISNKVGYNVNIYFEYLLSRMFRLRFEPYFEHYGYEKSNLHLIDFTYQDLSADCSFNNFGANLGVVINIW